MQLVMTYDFMPNLCQHLAASGLAVVRAGGTATLEMTAQQPFLYFPPEGHCEQSDGAHKVNQRQ